MGWWSSLFGRPEPSPEPIAAEQVVPESPTPAPERAPEPAPAQAPEPEPDAEISPARLDAALSRLREEIPAPDDARGPEL